MGCCFLALPPFNTSPRLTCAGYLQEVPCKKESFRGRTPPLSILSAFERIRGTCQQCRMRDVVTSFNTSPRVTGAGYLLKVPHKRESFCARGIPCNPPPFPLTLGWSSPWVASVQWVPAREGFLMGGCNLPQTLLLQLQRNAIKRRAVNPFRTRHTSIMFARQRGAARGLLSRASLMARDTSRVRSSCRPHV